MYYRERIINGVLHFKSTPNGKFKKFSKKQLTSRIVKLQNKDIEIPNNYKPFI